MPRARHLWLLLLILPLAGCYADQKKQLDACETQAAQAFPRPTADQPLKSIQGCMDKAGYTFVAWNDTSGETVQCDMAAVVRGVPSASGTDAMCFQPKGWLALKIYRIEVPVKAAAN